MLYRVLRKTKRVVNRILNKENKINVDDQALISSFISKPDFPWLISFPRAGSHWLRMIMELYFEKPSLTRFFYYENATDFTCYHRHDVDLSIEGCKSVIYLYRNPPDTVYSQLRYHRENIRSMTRVKYWAQLYGKHVSKWLFDETFTTRKTVVTYESMKSDMHAAFKNVCDHFDCQLDHEKLDSAVQQVSKEKLKEKSKDDPQVINLTPAYEKKRKLFKEGFSSVIYDTVYAQNEKLRDVFIEFTEE
jgi:regulator of replication initiation timing